jgi:AbrB family looped-hinge helix DNA binding protein
LVIPSAVRKALGLRAGTQFHLRLEEGKIILEPIKTSPIETLCGKYSDADFLTDLETEHKKEIMDETEARA